MKEKIEQRIKALQLTNEDVSKKLNMSKKDFEMKKNNFYLFSNNELIALSKILKIKNPIDFFLTSGLQKMNNPLKERKITMNRKIDFKIYLPKNLLIKREEEFNKLIEIIADAKEKHPNIRMGVEVHFYGDEFEE